MRRRCAGGAGWEEHGGRRWGRAAFVAGELDAEAAAELGEAEGGGGGGGGRGGGVARGGGFFAACACGGSGVQGRGARAALLRAEMRTGEYPRRLPEAESTPPLRSAGRIGRRRSPRRETVRRLRLPGAPACARAGGSAAQRGELRKARAPCPRALRSSERRQAGSGSRAAVTGRRSTRSVTRRTRDLAPPRLGAESEIFREVLHGAAERAFGAQHHSCSGMAVCMAPNEAALRTRPHL